LKQPKLCRQNNLRNEQQQVQHYGLGFASVFPGVARANNGQQTSITINEFNIAIMKSCDFDISVRVEIIYMANHLIYNDLS
jgi:hypothetical protein